ncbi:hypothetical protein HPB50_002730 [Hyalomma asiaticum]|uniref:Uncharacterized protein n=1 Tax=Hyalomma asiaticum TaxID=266040 RepID=A0ACB7TBM2_HYAAI|nr:hypothetical protein HPB50_002730 [Hyalomma asiaticum]
MSRRRYFSTRETVDLQMQPARWASCAAEVAARNRSSCRALVTPLRGKVRRADVTLARFPRSAGAPRDMGIKGRGDGDVRRLASAANGGAGLPPPPLSLSPSSPLILAKDAWTRYTGRLHLARNAPRCRPPPFVPSHERHFRLGMVTHSPPPPETCVSASILSEGPPPRRRPALLFRMPHNGTALCESAIPRGLLSPLRGNLRSKLAPLLFMLLILPRHLK